MWSRRGSWILEALVMCEGGDMTAEHTVSKNAKQEIVPEVDDGMCIVLNLTAEHSGCMKAKQENAGENEKTVQHELVCLHVVNGDEGKLKVEARGLLVRLVSDLHWAKAMQENVPEVDNGMDTALNLAAEHSGCMKAKQDSAEKNYAHLAKAIGEGMLGKKRLLMRGVFKLEDVKLAVKGLTYLKGEQNRIKAT